MLTLPISESAYNLIRMLSGKRPKIQKVDSDLYRIVPESSNAFYLTSGSFDNQPESVDAILILTECDVELNPERFNIRDIRDTYRELTQVPMTDVPELAELLGGTA